MEEDARELEQFLSALLGHPITMIQETDTAMTPTRFCQTLVQVLSAYGVVSLSTYKGTARFSLSLLPGEGGGSLVFRTPNTVYTLEVPLP